MRGLVDLVRSEQEKGNVASHVDPRIIVAGLCALGLGLIVFEKYLLPGAGLDDEPSTEVIKKIVADWIDLIAP